MGSSPDRSLKQTSQDTPGPVSVSACKLAGERGVELADRAVEGGGGDTRGHRPVTYRDIVGDTIEWKVLHRKEIYRAIDPERLKAVKLIAKAEHRDALDALAEFPQKKRTNERRSPSGQYCQCGRRNRGA